MTIREVTALVLLYRACRDAALRTRVEGLVPELTELAEVIVPFPSQPVVELIDQQLDQLAGQLTEEYAKLGIIKSIDEVRKELGLDPLPKG